MSLKRNECRVSRRGKGAKGSVLISTFGVPVKPKKPNGGITKKWSYSFASKLKLTDVIDAVKAIGDINQILLIGADTWLKSASIRAQSEVNIFAEMLLAQGLAFDMEEAKTVADTIRQTKANMVKCGASPEDAMEFLLSNRKRVVEKLKADNLWKATPKLVKKEKPVEEVEESDDDDIEEDDDIDSDDEEEVTD